MLERIKKIKNIGTYEDAGNGSLQLKPFTFIYGANTYGKTTLCDIFRSLKYNDISIINSRKRYGIANLDECYVDLTYNNKNI